MPARATPSGSMIARSSAGRELRRALRPGAFMRPRIVPGDPGRDRSVRASDFRAEYPRSRPMQRSSHASNLVSASPRFRGAVGPSRGAGVDLGGAMRSRSRGLKRCLPVESCGAGHCRPAHHAHGGAGQPRGQPRRPGSGRCPTTGRAVSLPGRACRQPRLFPGQEVVAHDERRDLRRRPQGHHLDLDRRAQRPDARLREGRHDLHVPGGLHGRPVRD